MHFREAVPLAPLAPFGAKGKWKKIHKAMRHDYKRGL